MAVDLNDMAGKIKTVLQGVSSLNSTFDYEPQQLQIFPVATLYFDGFTATEATMSLIEYEWKWLLRIYVNITTTDISIPQQTLRTISTDILKQLRANIQLNGACLYHTVTNGDVSVSLNQTNPMLVHELTIVATTQEPR